MSIDLVELDLIMDKAGYCRVADWAGLFRDAGEALGLTFEHRAGASALDHCCALLLTPTGRHHNKTVRFFLATQNQTLLCGADLKRNGAPVHLQQFSRVATSTLQEAKKALMAWAELYQVDSLALQAECNAIAHRITDSNHAFGQ